MARRWRAVRELAREVGARAVAVIGHGGGNAEVSYLTNVAVRWESLVVVSLDDDQPPRLLLQLDNHAAGAAGWTKVPITVTGPKLAAMGAALLAEHLGPTDAVALLGPITERTALALRLALDGRPIIDISLDYRRGRMVKGDEELAWVAWAARACDRAIAGFRSDARPGMREDELAALLTSLVVREGAQPAICFVATAPSTGGEAVVPRQVPARRRVGAGDLLLFELSAGMGGVTTQVLRTICLGGEPAMAARQVHDVADACFAALLDAVVPGRTAAELETLGSSIIEGAGMTIVDDLVHGYGGGYLPPVLRTNTTRRDATPALALVPGMLLVLQPNVVSGDLRVGVQTGELVAVTNQGARTFHSTSRGMLTTSID